MAPAIRVRRLAYRIAAQLLRVLRPLVPIDWGGVKCVLTDGYRVLLVRHTYGSRLWDLPGGAVTAVSDRSTPLGGRCARSSALRSTTGGR